MSSDTRTFIFHSFTHASEHVKYFPIFVLVGNVFTRLHQGGNVVSEERQHTCLSR